MAEKEYIEREAAIGAVKKERDYTGKFTFEEEHAWAVGFQQGITFALSDIAAIPAADVRPVVKAKWVYTDMSRLVCSNCGNPVAFALKEDGWHHGDYCSNCGARMEES